MNTQTPNLAPEIIANLEHLFYVYSPGEISYYIRKLLVCFVINEKDASDYQDNLINTIDLLMDFLEVADYCGVNTETDKAHLRKEELSGNHENVEIQSGEPVKGSTEEIVRFLVQLIQPEKVFCVPSRDPTKQDGQPLYDFLIIVPDSSQIPFKDYETLINLIHVKDTKISFTLHRATTIYKQLADGHLFYSAICTTDHLVYDSGSSQFPTVDATYLATKRLEAQKEFGVFYEKALSYRFQNTYPGTYTPKGSGQEFSYPKLRYTSLLP